MNTLMYITPWFMRMFTNFDDWGLALYTFDFSIRHGVAGMFRLALSIIALLRDRLLEAPDISRVLPCLLYLPMDLINQESLEATLPGVQVTREQIEQIELDLKLRRREAKHSSSSTRTDPEYSSTSKEKPLNQEEAGGIFDRLMTPVRRHFGWGVSTPSRPAAPATTPVSAAPGHPSTASRHLSPGGRASFVEFSTPTPMRQKRKLEGSEEPVSTSSTAKPTPTAAKKLKGVETPSTNNTATAKRTVPVMSPGTEMEEREGAWHGAALTFDLQKEEDSS